MNLSQKAKFFFATNSDKAVVLTFNNITSTRFSRNKKISRVMTEFELVRELNEGVKKIYSDMEKANLPPPEYKATDGTVRLILRNDIDRRIPQTKEIFDGTSTVEIYIF